MPGADDGTYVNAIREAVNRRSDWMCAWHIEDRPRAFTPWIRLLNRHAVTPDQGWKLHVSATTITAEEVLHRALHVLLDETACFKVATSCKALSELNGGMGAASQVGKFITVYPNSDEQAVRLAAALDAATHGLRGPRIPSDRPLSPDSLVHYRYGAFRDRRVRNAIGAIKPAILTPEGVPVPDDRGGGFRPPSWVVDPFETAGIVHDPPPPSPIIAGRYLALAPLYRSARSSIHLAMDLDDPKRCVLKRGRRHAGVDSNGQDATDRIRHEADILSRLAPDPRFPAVYDLLDDGDVYLVMEDVEGETLEEAVRAVVHRGSQLPPETLTRWARELASALAAIHARGLLYRDLKSANILVTPEGHIRILDFDAAFDPTADRNSPLTGTYGYMSPQHERGEPPTTQDDIYGFGAVLYFIATGVEPSNAPDRFRLLDRPVALLNPTIDPGFVRIIERCLDPDPAMRFASAVQVLDALQELEQCDRSHGSAVTEDPQISLLDCVAEQARTRARALADTLCAVSITTQDGEGRFWLTTHGERNGYRSPDLNTGNAGTVLALAELVDTFNDPDHRETLRAGARALIDSPRPEGPSLAGLYVGESGVGAALLRAGQVLADRSLIEAASAQGRLVETMPWASPDLFNGTAGRLRFHLWLWDETGLDEHLRAARAAGERLIDTAERAGDLAYWRFPDGFESLSGQAQPGYAHGAAGIADALLDLYEATGDGLYRDMAVRAGRWIASLTFDMLEDGSGANWPVQPEGPRTFAFWCHGAAGIGRFLLHLGETGGFPDAARLAAQAARTVAHGTRWAGPTQCHGLAGNLEFLLDMYQATGDGQYLVDAQVLGRLLMAFAVERDGHLMFPSESSRVFTPDYMVGYAGVAVALLRLADPLHRPHQLSRKGFRYRSPPVPAGHASAAGPAEREVSLGTR